MVDRPDPDKPGLPQLRRFRIDPSGSGRHQEVTPQPSDGESDAGSHTRQLPQQGSDTPTDRPPYADSDQDDDTVLLDQDDDYSYDDPDTLLRETDDSLGQPNWSPTPPPPSASQPTQNLNEATAPVGPPPGGVPPQHNGWATAPAGAEPPMPPPGQAPDAAPDEPSKKGNKLALIIGVAAAVVVIALLLWLFVFDSSDDDSNDPPAETTTSVESTPPGESENSEDADESDRDDEGVPSGGNEESEPKSEPESEPSGSGGNDEDDGGVRTTDGEDGPTMPGASAGPTSKARG